MAQFLLQALRSDQTGRKGNEYIISNPGGLSVSVLDYGCVIKKLSYPPRTGRWMWCWATTPSPITRRTLIPAAPAAARSWAATPTASRMPSSAWAAATYKLEANNGTNHLHGSFHRKLYRVKAFGDTLLMEAESPDGEDGFPGNLKIAVRYILTEDNAFRMDYRVSSDADTIVNLTNHSYFNLDGGGDVLGQKLRIYASRYLEGNNQTCPTGAILPVADTPMDFRRASSLAGTSTPALPRPPWWAAATTTAMSSTAPAVPARASAPGPPAIRPASA